MLPPLQQFHSKRESMQRLESVLDGDPAAAAAFPERLAAAGSSYTIDAATLRKAGLYRVGVS